MMDINFDEIAAEICEKYCKYPDEYDEEKEGVPLCDSEICKNCPLNKITAVKEVLIWVG